MASNGQWRARAPGAPKDPREVALKAMEAIKGSIFHFSFVDTAPPKMGNGVLAKPSLLPLEGLDKRVVKRRGFPFFPAGGRSACGAFSFFFGSALRRFIRFLFH